MELNANKTHLLEFGKYAAVNRQKCGKGKPHAFTFLGFTHACGKTRASGRFKLVRLTQSDKYRNKIKQIKVELRRRINDPVPEVGKWLKSVLTGHYNYYGVPGNSVKMNNFREDVRIRWWRTA